MDWKDDLEWICIVTLFAGIAWSFLMALFSGFELPWWKCVIGGFGIGFGLAIFPIVMNSMNIPVNMDENP